ncbi:MAG: hypothetical protein K2L16_05680 [Muribaculaceae bacterium]|nr:hypothetical protein [Muribaculaceae bacterium]
MKKTLLTLILALVALTASARFSAGIRDSRYVYGSYIPLPGLSVGLNHSLYSEKAGFQRVGLHVGYGMDFAKGFHWHATAHAATTWNGNYQLVDADITMAYTYRRLGLKAGIQPRYDSGLGYTTCWQAGASLRIVKQISILAAYTTIPEFRMSEKRLRGGFSFNVANLTVTPELSVSLDRSTRFKNLRVLMSMNYNF